MVKPQDVKVLIIGAGPGGLSLAQILRGQNIPFEIFERDNEDSPRQQGWAVALVECLPDLEELLPADLGDLTDISVNHALGSLDTIGVMDADSGKTIGGIGSVPKGEPGYMLRPNRERFRHFLFNHLPIRWGKTFDHYGENSDGITAVFTDGSRAQGTVLVGSDGAHSRIRKQLLGETASLGIPSAYAVIIQETMLTREQYLPIHDLGSAAVIASKKDLRYLVGMLESYDNGATAKYYTATCWKTDDPKKANEWVAKASKKELYDKVWEFIQGLPSVLTDIVRIGGVESMSSNQIKFEEFVPPEVLPQGRVTLLGDAAHTMVPFRGAGANTAIGDACLFAKTLIKQIKETKENGDFETGWFLQTYDKGMLPRGREMVLSSRAAGEDILGPLTGRQNTLKHD